MYWRLRSNFRLVKHRLHCQQGMTLLEAIVFMVILSVAIGAVLNMLAKTNAGSAQLLAQRQALAIAEAMMNEVGSSPFLSTEPLSPGGPEVGETRTTFNHINDYQGFAMNSSTQGIKGATIIPLGQYTTVVSVQPTTGAWNGIPAANVAHITITVTAPTLDGRVVLDGVRTRHSPTTPLP